MRILIVDDYAIFRRGVKDILADHFPNAVFGEAGSAQSALDQALKSPWDVMLLDFTLPGPCGLEILQEVRKSRPELPILMMSMSADEQYAVTFLEAGAAGFLAKAQAPRELVAVRRKTARWRKILQSFR